MIALVCGDRYWSDRTYLYEQLNHMHDLYHFTAVIEGECTGADEFAGDWAQEKGIPILTRVPWIPVRPNTRTSRAVNEGAERGYPALWHMYQHRAGPIRNKEMLDVGKPNIGIAFHNDFENSKGTKNMVELMRNKKVSNIYIFNSIKKNEIHYTYLGMF